MTRPSKRAEAQKAAKPRSAKPAREGQAATRSKPRTRKSTGKPKIVTRTLVWRGALIAIQYRPAEPGYTAHLAVRVTTPDKMPLPVSETGYCSRYLDAVAVKLAGGPVAYVRRWLEREAGSKTYLRALDRWRQLDLFAALES